MKKFIECLVWWLAIFLIVFGIYKTVFGLSEPVMDSQERKTMMEAQAKDAAKRAKIKYVTYALRRAELPDNEFLDHGREDVQSLGRDLLGCWKDSDAQEAEITKLKSELNARTMELDGIKRILLERKP